MPTLEDVAKRAGVSTATVSRVLSNTPYFTEETREKVMMAAQALGYVPHSAARALASGRTNIIAFVFPYVKEGISDDPAITQILQGVEDEARLHGYHVLMISPDVHSDVDDERYRNIIASRNIDGSVVIPTAVEYSMSRLPREYDIPFVSIGYEDSPYNVISDGSSGGTQLMQHLLDLGHRQIGIISAYEQRPYVRDRLNGMRQVAEEFGLDFDTLPRFEGDFAIPSGSQGAAYLLNRYPELTAIIALNDRMAIGAIQKAREMDYRVPEDLSVCGYDNIPMASLFVPQLTTIDHHASEMGRQAMRMLSQILKGENPDPLCLRVTLCIGQSTAPPRV